MIDSEAGNGNEMLGGRVNDDAHDDAHEDGVLAAGDPIGEAAETSVADAYELRLTALLHQLVSKRGHKGAARVLGLDHRTVSTSVREGMSRRVRDALAQALVDRDGDARDRLEDDFEEFRERFEAWAQELRDGLNAVQGQVEALGQQQGERMRRIEGRVTGVEAERGGTAAGWADVAGRRPGARPAAVTPTW